MRRNKQYLFTTDICWRGKERGVINSGSASHPIFVSNPPEFGGTDGDWSAEQLLLGAVTACIMRTYLDLSRQMQFESNGFECAATGQVEVVDEQFRFTYIHLYPRAYITSAADEYKARMAMEKARKHCIVSNSISATIIQHPEIVIGRPAAKIRREARSGNRRFSAAEVRQIGKKIGVDFSQIDPEEFRKGLKVEMEHGSRFRECNVTNDNVYLAGKIAWAHLREIPDYYTRLDKMEKEAERETRHLFG